MSEASSCDFTRDLIPASAFPQSKLESGLGISQCSFSDLGVEDGDALSHPLSEALRHVLLICTN